MLLRVHPSNYKITGFTEMPELPALAALALEKNIVLYEDAGSGALIDMTQYGLVDEPVIGDSIEAGVDIVSFSGDKLLGGPQAGIIVGRRLLIEKLRRDPLYRALRVSKIVYAALESTLEAYARSTAESDIPVLRMLALSSDQIESRTTAFVERLSALDGLEQLLRMRVIDGKSVHPGTSLLAIRPVGESAAAFERRLRTGEMPVVARLRDDHVLMDLRTVNNAEEDDLLVAIADAAANGR
jgi:L-seryl-tRNA(Ser) seleniumtransferase